MLKWISVNDFKPQYVVHWMHLTKIWGMAYVEKESENGLCKREDNSFGITFSNSSAQYRGQHTTEWLCNILSVHIDMEMHMRHTIRISSSDPSTFLAALFLTLSLIQNSKWSFWCDVNIFNYIRNKRDQMQTVYFSWWIMHLTVHCKRTLKDRLGIECIYVPKAPNETQSNTWRVFVCIFCN